MLFRGMDCLSHILLSAREVPVAGPGSKARTPNTNHENSMFTQRVEQAAHTQKRRSRRLLQEYRAGVARGAGFIQETILFNPFEESDARKAQQRMAEKARQRPKRVDMKIPSFTNRQAQCEVISEPPHSRGQIRQSMKEQDIGVREGQTDNSHHQSRDSSPEKVLDGNQSVVAKPGILVDHFLSAARDWEIPRNSDEEDKLGTRDIFLSGMPFQDAAKKSVALNRVLFVFLYRLSSSYFLFSLYCDENMDHMYVAVLRRQFQGKSLTSCCFHHWSELNSNYFVARDKMVIAIG